MCSVLVCFLDSSSPSRQSICPSATASLCKHTPVLQRKAPFLHSDKRINTQSQYERWNMWSCSMFVYHIREDSKPHRSEDILKVGIVKAGITHFKIWWVFTNIKPSWIQTSYYSKSNNWAGLQFHKSCLTDVSFTKDSMRKVIFGSLQYLKRPLGLIGSN